MQYFLMKDLIGSVGCWIKFFRVNTLSVCCVGMGVWCGSGSVVCKYGQLSR